MSADRDRPRRPPPRQPQPPPASNPRPSGAPHSGKGVSPPPTHGFKFARASGDHLLDIIEIERLSFSEPWPETAFLEELANDNASYFVALSPGGAVVGFCGYWRVADEAHVMNIAVNPRERRHGVGMELLRLLLRDAAERGMVIAFLEVREDNAPAIALYERFGFVRCGFRENYYAKEGKSAIVMRASL